MFIVTISYSMAIQHDKKLLKQLNAGNEQAFIKVYDAFAERIFRHIYYKVGQNKELAEDLSQQTFFKAWEYISKGKEVESIQAFLYRIASNLVVDLWRGKEKESLPLKDELIETTEDSPRWREVIEAKVSVEILQRSLDELNDQYREVLILRYLQDLEIAEIADILEKDKNNIYVLIHRATKALQKVLADIH